MRGQLDLVTGLLLALLLAVPTGRGLGFLLSPAPTEIILGGKPSGSVWALVVGISDYKEVLDLRYARRDAAAVYAWLVGTAGVPQDHVRLLLNSQATLVGVQAGLEWLRQRAGPEDLVIFYFSGHGYQEADRPPLDEQDGLDGYLVLYDTKLGMVEVTALGDDALGHWLDTIAPTMVVLILDCGYMGAGGLAGVNRLILAGSGEGECTWEDGEVGHGVFTYFLLQGLDRGDEDDDGWISLQEAFRFAGRNVQAVARDRFRISQSPEMTDGIGKAVLRVPAKGGAAVGK